MIWEYDTSLGKKIEKCVAVQVNFTDTVLYIEQTGLQWREWKRIPFGVELHCCTFRLQPWTHKSLCDIHFIDLVLQYLPFHSSTLYKIHLFQYLSPILYIVTYKAFSEDESVLWGVNSHHFPYKSFRLLAVFIYRSPCLHNDNAVSISEGIIWRWNVLLVFFSTCPRATYWEYDSGISCKTVNLWLQLWQPY